MLKIDKKSGYFIDQNNRCPLFLCGFKTNLPHNTIFCTGDERNFSSIAKQAKKEGKYILLQPFSALYFRGSAADGQDTGLKDTPWWTGSVEQSKRNFFESAEAMKIQINGIQSKIDTCISAGVDFAFSLLWEAQVLAGYAPAQKWFTKIRDSLKNTYGKRFPVGIHSHVEKQYRLADFIVIEGNFAGELLHGAIPGKPVIIIARNPGVWPSGHPERYRHGYDSKNIEWVLKPESVTEIVDYGSTGVAYKRWVDIDTLRGDLPKGFNLNKYNAGEFKKAMASFYATLLKKIKNSDRRYLPKNFCLELTIKPEPKEDKPTPDPVELKPEVQEKEPVDQPPVEKEIKMNFAQRILVAFDRTTAPIGKAMRKRYYITAPVWLGAIAATGLVLGAPAAVLMAAGSVGGVVLVNGKEEPPPEPPPDDPPPEK